MLSILFRNLRFTRTDGRYRFFENGKVKEVTRFVSLSEAECSNASVQRHWFGCARIDRKHYKHECQKSKLLPMQVREGGCKY